MILHVIQSLPVLVASSPQNTDCMPKHTDTVQVSTSPSGRNEPAGVPCPWVLGIRFNEQKLLVSLRA